MRIVEGYQSIKELLSRQVSRQGFGDDAKERAVRDIIAAVRERGDAALIEFTEKFDSVKLTSLEVDKEEIKRAAREIDAELLTALKLTGERIADFHKVQRDALVRDSKGGNLGWIMRPLYRVGIHAPGFTAPLPSSVLMTAIPAKVAGVKEVIMVTPPGKHGKISPLTLAAADITGIDRVFSVGGAQAIAALAFGTESVPAVDKICGPGNIYVFLAKKLLYGVVGIDGLYGPSEVIIIADDTASAEYCAADLLAQAEHDVMATAILLTTSRRLADGVNAEVEKQASALTHHETALESLESRGFIGVISSVNEAVELANLYAPEHLCLVVDKPDTYAGQVANAGCLFLGEHSVEVLVDYVAGPSHVLPTEGTARFGSPLNILDFVKIMNVVATGESDIRKLGKAASVIARAEGLDAHARAIEKRLDKKK
jgi:histidinol dehydrogenase